MNFYEDLYSSTVHDIIPKITDEYFMSIFRILDALNILEVFSRRSHEYVMNNLLNPHD